MAATQKSLCAIPADPIEFPADANTLDYARSEDAKCPIRHMREHFIFPTRASLKKKALDGRLPAYPPNHAKPGETATAQNGTSNTNDDNVTPAVYFCGNSLGLQPKATRDHINAQLETWASIGVHGHFTSWDNSPLKSWQDMAADCAAQSASVVGASPDEIAIMNTLTANLHFMMASFYRPTEKRHKIISEWKPFPSDTYAIASQIQWHGFDTATSLVELHPDENYYISTEKILATIDEHAESTALLLLPGIQYWSGQLFDMPLITAHARAKGIVVGWDLAHAVGNVPLSLHDWDVDFAVWCTYKYLNAGPGAIAGAFVHERHGKVDSDGFKLRLSGWYGNNKATRFNMAKDFDPTPGAQGWVVSNPSGIDLASLGAALSVYNLTTPADLRKKSLRLTAYAEHLLNGILEDEAASSAGDGKKPAFRIITPSNKNERGAQLSVLLREGLLDVVGEKMEAAGVVCDRRKPDVMRVAPVPMYNSYEDVWRCVDALRKAVMS
ncbi:Kynureninase (L-kynurenine hydrolase) [Pyricularia oryzae]|nr:Kynureninase (L-kynurenine hydrolase) [Pyricularia oryzae]KAI6324303.1 Kynureninase (L-kynurenine hydrolase) [Pyricularia oryzae]KAI6362479.1 Kynureninase (L-kynurenine hydrolase) [Pyricularia oryzae]KAI6420552.1 Kynureninase (L-kynurenine hydrolase) [Pyricularia oryzae]KAI6496934.1 Kynureninase (L-kynurenine hydrolase) [Pyricularia oryzae]